MGFSRAVAPVWGFSRDMMGSDHELLIAKFRLKLKKVGKTTRQFRYDLNQIPYDYTLEMARLTISALGDGQFLEVRGLALACCKGEQPSCG